MEFMDQTAELRGRYRTSRETWPDFIKEARNNPLLERRLSDFEVGCLVAVHSPYTFEHVMIVPDFLSGEGAIQNITDLSRDGLNGFLRFNADVARVLSVDPTLRVVDLGYNFTTDSSDRRKLASVPDRLHSHVVGYTQEELSRAINQQDLRKHPQWRPGMYDPLQLLYHEVLKHQVIDQLRGQNPAFDGLFTQTVSGHNGLTYLFKKGIDGFYDPDLGGILRSLHQMGQTAYNELVSCFCVVNPDNGQFVESSGRRFELLPQDDRLSRIKQYFKQHPWLSEDHRSTLANLARRIKTEDRVIETAVAKSERFKDRELTLEERKQVTRDTIDRVWAIKDFAYTAVWSWAGEGWYFGFDPRVFSATGIPVSGRAGVSKVFWRTGEVFSEHELASAQQFEQELVISLTK